MRARALTATVLAVLALAGCGSNDTPPDAAPPAATAGTPAASQEGSTTEPTGSVGGAAITTTVGVGDTPSSLQFNVPLVGGGQLDGATLAGRPIALWFWAPT